MGNKRDVAFVSEMSAKMPRWYNREIEWVKKGFADLSYKEWEEIHELIEAEYKKGYEDAHDNKGNYYNDNH